MSIYCDATLYSTLISSKDTPLKTLLAALLTLAFINVAHASDDFDNTIQRVAGSCIAIQSARLDNGKLPLDVISKAVAAGCMPVLRTALAQNSELTMPAIGHALLREQVGDELDISYVLEDMAANAVSWLRGPGRSHVLELQGHEKFAVASAN